MEMYSARMSVLQAPERSLPNPMLQREKQIADALEHRRLRMAESHSNETDDGQTVPSSSRGAAAPLQAQRSLRSRNKKDGRRNKAGSAAAAAHVNDGLPPLLASTASSSAAGSPSVKMESPQTPPKTGQAKGGDIFSYVEDDDLHIALEDALACITDPQDTEPREVVTDAASALAKMRLVHTAMFLRFAARLNVGARRSDDEEAENFDIFTNLCTLFNCADTRVVAAMLDILAHKFAEESSAFTSSKTSSPSAKSRTTAATGHGSPPVVATVKEEQDWKHLPVISMDDADEFIPFSSDAGVVPINAPSKLVVEDTPLHRVVATVDVEPGTVLHILPNVIVRGEKYAVDEKTGEGILFTRGSCRGSGTYTVGCNFERAARIATNEDPVLQQMRQACACNASLYLVAVSDGGEDTEMTDDDSKKPRRVMAVIADSPIAAKEEVTLPQEMLWEACLVAPPCFCASSQPNPSTASPPPPQPLPMSPLSIDATSMTDSPPGAAPAAPEPASVDDHSPEAEEEEATPLNGNGGACALKEFFDLRNKLFVSVLSNGASSLLSAKASQKRKQQQQQQRSRPGPRSGRSRSARGGRRSAGGNGGGNRKKQSRKRTLSPLMPSLHDPKPAMSREDRKLQAICETFRRLDEHPVTKRRHTTSESADA